MLHSRRRSGSALRVLTTVMQGLRPTAVALALLSCVGVIRAQEADWATVLRILDGQTIEVEWRGAREIVRYIGVGAPRFRQGRLLAYVFTQEGTFVNAWLIEFGFAEAVSQADLSRLEREAREKSRGLWMRQ